MEGNNVIKNSYDYLVKLQRANATDNISIDYTKLDQKTKNIITKALDDVISKRKRELQSLLIGVNKYM